MCPLTRVPARCRPTTNEGLGTRGRPGSRQYPLCSSPRPILADPLNGRPLSRPRPRVLVVNLDHTFGASRAEPATKGRLWGSKTMTEHRRPTPGSAVQGPPNCPNLLAWPGALCCSQDPTQPRLRLRLHQPHLGRPAPDSGRSLGRRAGRGQRRAELDRGSDSLSCRTQLSHTGRADHLHPRRQRSPDLPDRPTQKKNKKPVPGSSQRLVQKKNKKPVPGSSQRLVQWAYRARDPAHKMGSSPSPSATIRPRLSNLTRSRGRSTVFNQHF